MNAFDTTAFHVLNHSAGSLPVVDSVMIAAAQYSPAVYAAILVAGWFTLPWKEQEHRHGIVAGIIAGAIAFGISNLIGAIWYRPRPFTILTTGTYHQLIPHAPDPSFPSDHVAVGAGIALGTYGHARRWIPVSTAAVTLLVAIARVYVGVHWPTDVIGGAVVGSAAGWAVLICSRYLRPLTLIILRLFRMR